MADRQTITVELDNVVGVTGLTEKVFVAMSVLVGDVNQNGAVTTEDVSLVQANVGVDLTSSNFRCDVNANGFVSGSDVNLDKVYAGEGASLAPDFAFTGHYYHARSGLYLTLYRAYNPSLGRWLSRDPLGEVVGLNLYAYLGNVPITRVDPLGLQSAAPSPPPTPIPFPPRPTGPFNLPQPVPGRPAPHPAPTPSGPSCDCPPRLKASEQDNICSSPVGAFNANRCAKQCCVEHDACYAAHNCHEDSWLKAGCWRECDKCNAKAVVCVLAALTDPLCWIR